MRPPDEEAPAGHGRSDPPRESRDELAAYLCGGSALSRRYHRESAPGPAHSLDRRVLARSRDAHRKPPCLAPLAFAASVLLSCAMVVALVFGPERAKRGDDPPRLIRAVMRADPPLRVYSSDPQRPRSPSAWLLDIAALRRAGRGEEADAEYRRFREAYPAWRAAAAATPAGTHTPATAARRDPTTGEFR